MRRILSLILLVGVLSGCQTDNPVPSYWNADYAQYMQKFGYKYVETDGIVSKNNTPIWSLPINCIRCVTTYIGPNGLHDNLLIDYNKSLEQSIEMYRQENLQILGLEN